MKTTGRVNPFEEFFFKGNRKTEKELEKGLFWLVYLFLYLRLKIL